MTINIETSYLVSDIITEVLNFKNIQLTEEETQELINKITSSEIIQKDLTEMIQINDK